MHDKYKSVKGSAVTNQEWAVKAILSQFTMAFICTISEGFNKTW